jgi:hypothetical protein
MREFDWKLNAVKNVRTVSLCIRFAGDAVDLRLLPTGQNALVRKDVPAKRNPWNLRMGVTFNL